MKKYEITFATFNLFNLNFKDSEQLTKHQGTAIKYLNENYSLEGWELVSVVKEKDFVVLFFQREIS